MDLILALLVGVLMASSVYLMLSRNLVRFVLGLAMISHAANLLIFAGGGVANTVQNAGTMASGLGQEASSDALAQALILTAIVISFSVFSFALVLAFRTYQMLDTVDTDAMRAAEPPAGRAGKPQGPT